ncbi:hypothetical protein MBRA1_000150 [Malassezia brasiliensis]|uniref:Protein BIG1 n=1 Tax=Malassezia brasiliensis TaxID=1821822 RepID=A0AAF0DPD5_9BASI|nr:hypothetical protein MBRA1_000150 [Malassezia brasiliensis]
MRGSLWLAPFVVACASLAHAHDAPMLAFLSPRADVNVLRAPELDTRAPRSPNVPADRAAARLVHHCHDNGVPEVCGLDALVHMEVDARDHASFAQKIDAQPSLRKRALQAPHQLVLPAIDQSAQSFGEALKSAIQSKCSGWRTASHRNYDASHRTLISIDAQGMSDAEMLNTLEDIERASPSHAVVITATSPKLHRRYIPVQPEQLHSRGKFLERYQLFSSATVLSLGVASFLVFFVLVAVHLLSTTETPDKLGSGRGVSYDKKRQ